MPINVALSDDSAKTLAKHFCLPALTCYNAVVNFLYPLLVVLLAIFAIAPLEYPGAFQSHSGLVAYYNLINLDQNPWQLLTWAPTIGHAYDVFRTEGPLAYLLSESVHLLGLSYLDSIKVVYAFAWVASGLSMYALARSAMSQNAALLASTLYVYLPFHVATVYVRGAFGESVAWALFPLALLALLRLSPAHQSSSPGAGQAKRYVLSMLPFALLFLTQPGLAIMFALTATATAILIKGGELGVLKKAAGIVLGGLGAGALLASPSVLAQGAAVNSGGFTPNYVLPFQLFSALWGSGVSRGTFLDQFPLQIGVAPLVIIICAIAVGWTKRDQTPSGPRRMVAACVGMAGLLTILTFEISSPVWRLLGALAEYPWQLVAFVGLLLVLGGAALVDFEPRLAQPTMLAVLVALPVVAAYGYLAPAYLDKAPSRPLIAVFGNNEIALLDYRIVGPLRHGATLRLELVWQALRPIDHDYTVFVHAVHEDNEVYGQVDEKPVQGAKPTLTWSTGQVITDTHTIQIDVEGPSEGYVLQVGLYYGANGQRALLEDGSDHLALPRPDDPEPAISDQVPVASAP